MSSHRATRLYALDTAYISLGVALIAVCSFLTVPAVIPFTLQTFAVCTVLGILGGKRGTVAILVYLAIGSIGVPVFAGMQGGIGVLLGPTGGFLWGFLLMGLCYLLLVRRTASHSFVPAMLALIIGHLLCYAVGALWYAYYAGTDLGAALLACVVPFLIPDAIKLAVSLPVSRAVRAHVPGLLQ